MTEANQVWAVARRYLDPFGHLERVENAVNKGTPDVNYRLRGSDGWVELKVGQREGRCPDHLTLEQVTWLERRAAAGGRAFLLMRVGPVWLLYDAAGARSLYNETDPRPLVRATGRFPLREILDHLAPLEKVGKCKTLRS